MADYSTEIKNLLEIIDGGVSSITVDGVSTRLSIPQARKRLNELRLQDETSQTTAMVRPVVSRIKIGGCW